MNDKEKELQSINMGSRLSPKLRVVDFPNADAIVRELEPFLEADVR